MFSSGDGQLNFYSNGVLAFTISPGGATQLYGYNIARALSGGYKIQSGQFTTQNLTSAVTNTVVSFPVGFGTTPIVVVTPLNTATNSQLGKNYSTSYDFSVYGVSASGFTLVNNQNGPIIFNWIAIGN